MAKRHSKILPDTDPFTLFEVGTMQATIKKRSLGFPMCPLPINSIINRRILSAIEIQNPAFLEK